MGSYSSHKVIGKNNESVISVQDLIRMCGCDEVVNLVMKTRVDSSLSPRRKEGISMRLRADLNDVLSARPQIADETVAVASNDLSALRCVSWEQALSLPVIVSSNCSVQHRSQLAADIVWEMIEVGK